MPDLSPQILIHCGQSVDRFEENGCSIEFLLKQFHQIYFEAQVPRGILIELVYVTPVVKTNLEVR